MGLVIEDLESFHHINDEIICCVGKQLFSNPTRAFAKGIEYKHGWLRKQIKNYGKAGKIAYKGVDPVGFLEFVPGKIAPIISDEKNSCVYIDCYYVLQHEQNKGVGSALIKATVEEFSKGHPWFEGKPAKAIKLLAFEDSAWKMAEPFHKMGFKTELKLTYAGTACRRIPLLLTFDSEPTKRRPKEILVKLPTRKELPLLVKTFVSTICPYGSPDFPEVKRLVRKFGRKVKFEIFDLWKNPELVKTYGPHPGTVVNDQLVWASPEEYMTKLESTINEHLQKLEPVT